MKKRVFIVHGWSDNSDSSCLPWLKTELEKLGHQVFATLMPEPDNPVIEKWVEKLAKTVGQPDQDTYFVGHSIGCQTILRYLDSYQFGPQEKVGGAIFIAGWFDLKNLEDKETEEIAKPWINTPINLNKIKTVLPKSTLIISDNDPFDCFEENVKNFKKINSKIIVMPNSGHLSLDDGFDKLPEALDEFKKF